MKPSNLIKYVLCLSLVFTSVRSERAHASGTAALALIAVSMSLLSIARILGRLSETRSRGPYIPPPPRQIVHRLNLTEHLSNYEFSMNLEDAHERLIRGDTKIEDRGIIATSMARDMVNYARTGDTFEGRLQVRLSYKSETNVSSFIRVLSDKSALDLNPDEISDEVKAALWTYATVFKLEAYLREENIPANDYRYQLIARAFVSLVTAMGEDQVAKNSEKLAQASFINDPLTFTPVSELLMRPNELKQIAKVHAPTDYTPSKIFRDEMAWGIAGGAVAGIGAFITTLVYSLPMLRYLETWQVMGIVLSTVLIVPPAAGFSTVGLIRLGQEMNRRLKELKADRISPAIREQIQNGCESALR